MEMPAYQSRVIEERNELRDKYNKLKLFLGTERAMKLEQENQPEFKRLVLQLHYMGRYLDILSDRICSFERVG